MALIISTIHDIPNKAVFQRAKMLAENYTLHIFTKRPAPDQIVQRAAVIHSCAGHRLRNLFFPVWAWWKIVRDPGIHYVYTVFSHNIVMLLIGYLCHLFGKTWIADLLDDPMLPLEKTGSPMVRAANKTLYSILKSVLRQADLIITLRGMAAMLQTQGFALPEKKILEVTNGVELTVTREKIARWTGSERPAGAFTAIYVGIIRIERGLATVVQAAGLLKDKIPGLRIVLAGWQLAADDLETLKKLIETLHIQDIVEFTGELAHDDILKRIAQSDVCLYPFPKLPHLEHVSPIKVFEYMGCGKPVVATDLKGVEGIVEDGRTGLIVPPEDPAALAASLLKLYEDPELRTEMGHHAALRSHEFDWNTINHVILQRIKTLA